MATMLFQGHASIRLTSKEGIVVYLDPFAGEGYDLPADLILSTHEHHDHNRMDIVAQKATTKIYRAGDMFKDGKYRTISECGIRVTAVPAYNQNHHRNECVGYIVEIDGITLYFAGDTSKTDEMSALADLKLDYALLPTDGFYNMGVDEASECAAIIQAKHAIPIHMKPGDLFDQEIAQQFQAQGKLIVHPGQMIQL